MLAVWLVAGALAESPEESSTAAEAGQQAVDAMWRCRPRREPECSAPVRRDCDAGNYASCGALGAWIAVDWTRREEAWPLLAKACEELGDHCVQAADLVPFEGARRERERGLLTRGCDAKDAAACAGLADSWDDSIDADIVLVIVALERACALADDYCVALAVALVRGPQSGVERGMALLHGGALKGNRAAIEALVAIRWGSKENLPEALASALETACTAELRRTRPERCRTFVAQLAPTRR